MPTLVNTTPGLKLVLKVEWVANSNTFETACTLNMDRSFNQAASIVNDIAPDCDDLDGVAWQTSEKDVLSATFSGSGKLNKADVKKFEAWLDSPDTLRCKVILDDDDAANVITRQGAFHLSQYDETGQRKQKVTANITLVSDGALTRTYGANVD